MKSAAGHLNTFSLVAKDPKSGKICVAGTSHWFAYATMVPFIEVGIGAVATQAECKVSYGTEGLALIKKGMKPKDVVQQLIGADVQRDIRQLLVIDNEGNTAAFTGSKCVKFAGDFSEQNLAIAGNMLATEQVIPQMVEFYHSSNLPFELKVLKTLQKGQEAGGDIRGKRSAGMLVAEAKDTGTFWKGISYNLRTDDNPNPLQELERLYNIATAYQYMNLGDTEYYENKNNEEALKYYQKASELFPENPEPKFWHAKLLWDMGEKEKALELMKFVEKSGENWREYWNRIVNDKI